MSRLKRDHADRWRPAVELDQADIDLLCVALEHVGEVEAPGLETAPTAGEISALLALCRRWHEAEAAWWAQSSPSDAVDESPF